MAFCVSEWFKHILLVNTKGSGVAKLRRKPSPVSLIHKALAINDIHMTSLP